MRDAILETFDRLSFSRLSFSRLSFSLFSRSIRPRAPGLSRARVSGAKLGCFRAAIIPFLTSGGESFAARLPAFSPVRGGARRPVEA
jgi:hypothetical protein